MNSNVLLTYYCLIILLVSIAGGMIPIWVRLTHRWMECAVSFVAGVMLGIGLLHMLPHALDQAANSTVPLSTSNMQVMLWLLAGLLVMFFIERFFCFHHHEVEDGEVSCHHGPDGDHDHGHNLSWSGAALGLTLHSVIEGIALAAGVAHGHETVRLAGLGTFLVIVLHKPFDSMTIATLMAHGGWSLTWRHVVNGLFSLAIPLGILIFRFGLMGEGDGGETLSHALAFAAGTFLCIALSDLLPELQFHDHDRGKLSAALLLGLALAWGISQLESTTHSHPPALPKETQQVVLQI
ncbi:ZIP family metal transporter [Bythopirellula polymerisocia]|uniref:Zinc transporter ZupT n=1 Tax=Bythopirellula polymerisocia TaxID=2528003 RepID=A0A5C6CJU8_9BACT|nr:ZIP family metal transporter [Bythopirellula polymerisocia]TWU23774.1 zinc transporter ZupT [Bythopirellula polymerisocia]